MKLISGLIQGIKKHPVKAMGAAGIGAWLGSGFLRDNGDPGNNPQGVKMDEKRPGDGDLAATAKSTTDARGGVGAVPPLQYRVSTIPGGVRYDTPYGSMEATGLSEEKAMGKVLRSGGGNFTAMEKPTHFGGYDVSGMSQNEFQRFKIDYLNRVADMFRENRMLREGKGEAGISSGRVESGASGIPRIPAYQRDRMNREIRDVMRKIEEKKVTAAGGRNLLEAIRMKYAGAGVSAGAIPSSTSLARKKELAELQTRNLLRQQQATDQLLARIPQQRKKKYVIKEISKNGVPTLVRIDVESGKMTPIVMGE